MRNEKKTFTAQQRKSESRRSVGQEASCSQILNANKKVILQLFESEIRKKVPAAFDQDSSVLINSLPFFLEEMIDALRAGSKVGGSSLNSQISQDHGKQRADLSKYTLEQVLFEYTLFSRILLSFLLVRTEVSVEEFEIIQDLIQEGMLQAGAEFTKVQARLKDMAIKAGETMKQMTDSLPILFWWTDEDGTGNHFNKKWFEYTGLQENQPFGKQEDSFLERVHPDDRESNVQARELAVKEKRSAIFEERIQRWDGEYRWHLVRATPILDKAGKLVRWFATSSDIHDQKRAEWVKTKITEDLKTETVNLSSRNTELDRFAAIAAHDLKSPLNSMTQFTELLAQQYQGRLGAEADQYIGFILDAGKRMSSLIDNLLGYARAGAQYADDQEAIDLQETMAAVRKNLSYELRKTEANIVVQKNLPKVHGNRIQISQLFQNLLANAIKFHKPHEPPQIEIDFTDQGNFWCFSVRDEGIGMNPQYSSRIFEMFNKLGSGHEGSGIGLAVCQRIVESHGGKIHFRSEPGRGTVFFFTLPKSKAD